MCLPAVTVSYRAFNLRKIMEFAKFSKSCIFKQKIVNFPRICIKICVRPNTCKVSSPVLS